MNAIKKVLAWARIELVVLWVMLKVGAGHTAAGLWAGIKKVVALAGKVLEKTWFIVILFVHKGFITLPPRIWTSVKVFLWRLGFMLASWTRYYKNWSHLYQWLYERQYGIVPVSTYPTLEALQKVIATCTWTNDGAKELGDAFSSAGYIQHVIDGGGKRAIGDCDEFAMYNATAIRDSIDAGVWKDRLVKDTLVMTLCWLDKITGKHEGHNVCLIEWADGKYSYIDYFAPSNEASNMHDVALQVVNDYGGNQLVGWAIQDRNLDVLSTHWK